MSGWTRGAAAVALGAVLLLGCGGDGEDEAAGGATTSEAATEATSEAPETPAADDPTTTEAPTTTTSTTTAPPTTAPAATGPKPWQDLTVGECIGELPPGTFTEVTVVPCTEPHAAEAITAIRAVTISGGDATASAQATCDTELAAFAGPGRAAAPIVETQGTLLARAVCLVVDPSGAPLTGSVVTG